MKRVLDVDIVGMAKILERRGVDWIVYELLQNAWDTDTSKVEVTLQPIPGRPMAELVVTDDDLEGFAAMEDAWTLFAESLKKSDTEKRGRFNIGEKHVIAYSIAHGGSVTIATTKGTVVLDKDGRHTKRVKRKSGSEVRCVMRLTREQQADMTDAIHRLIVPVPTTFNGEALPERKPVGVIETPLQTETADEEGVLKRTTRKTSILIFEPLNGEVASLYEMGIPVVETGDRWHYDVQQKVPLSIERDNVPPSYLKAVRVAVMNEMHSEIEEDEATEAWVSEATADPRCAPDAVRTMTRHRFGQKAVSFDPSDPEANRRAAAAGFTVVHGGSMSKGQWANVKEIEAIKPAGHVRPSPKPYDENGRPERLIPEQKWTADMKRVVQYAREVARYCLGCDIEVRIVSEAKVAWRANYGEAALALNYGRLGKRWFADDSAEGMEKVHELLLHEFAHEYSGDHLSDEYHRALCHLGAKLTRMYMGEEPHGLGPESYRDEAVKTASVREAVSCPADEA